MLQSSGPGGHEPPWSRSARVAAPDSVKPERVRAGGGCILVWKPVDTPPASYQHGVGQVVERFRVTGMGDDRKAPRRRSPILSNLAWGVLACLGLVPHGCSSEAPDTTPPAQVTDLRVEAFTETTAVLTWTAPGDDGDRG